MFGYTVFVTVVIQHKHKIHKKWSFDCCVKKTNKKVKKQTRLKVANNDTEKKIHTHKIFHFRCPLTTAIRELLPAFLDTGPLRRKGHERDS